MTDVIDLDYPAAWPAAVRLLLAARNDDLVAQHDATDTAEAEVRIKGLRQLAANAEKA